MSDTHFHKLRVEKVTPETPDTVSITFEVPSDLKEIFTYEAGQYLTLRFLLGGKDVRRAYSMSSSPLEPSLTVTVKRVKKGLVSNYVFDQLRVGTEVDIMPPQGRFFPTLDVAQRKTYYLFGAGSGITPLMSIAKTVLEQEPQSSVHLLYGNRNAEGIIFKTQLDELQTRYAEQLFVEHVLSQPIQSGGGLLKSWFKKNDLSAWEGKTGRITAQMVSDFLTDHPSRTKNAEYFICGPGELTEMIEATLQKEGINGKNIHKELFSIPVGGDVAPVGSDVIVKNARLIAHLNGETVELVVPPKTNLLRALVDIKKDPPYSCTSGACSTCMAKVIRGSVKMESCYALDEDEIASGYILTCQSFPTSAEVEIVYE